MVLTETERSAVNTQALLLSFPITDERRLDIRPAKVHRERSKQYADEVHAVEGLIRDSSRSDASYTPAGVSLEWNYLVDSRILEYPYYRLSSRS
jgi:hypothetical protein